MIRKRDNSEKLPAKPKSQRITLEQAVDLTQRYRRSAPASEKAGFFYAKGIQELLAQPNVYGMRIYHGLDKKGAYRMVLVGVDQDGEDIVKTKVVVRSAIPLSKGPAPVAAFMSGGGGTGDAVLLDGHWPCPPWCPTNSPLT